MKVDGKCHCRILRIRQKGKKTKQIAMVKTSGRDLVKLKFKEQDQKHFQLNLKQERYFFLADGRDYIWQVCG